MLIDAVNYFVLGSGIVSFCATEEKVANTLGHENDKDIKPKEYATLRGSM